MGSPLFVFRKIFQDICLRCYGGRRRQVVPWAHRSTPPRLHPGPLRRPPRRAAPRLAPPVGYPGFGFDSYIYSPVESKTWGFHEHINISFHDPTGAAFATQTNHESRAGPGHNRVKRTFEHGLRFQCNQSAFYLRRLGRSIFAVLGPANSRTCIA